MGKYFFTASILLVLIFSSVTSTLSSGTAQLKSEDDYFDAIRRSSSAVNWINLANYYSENNQSDKVVKVTQKIMQDFPGNLNVIADIHNKAVTDLENKGVTQIGGKNLVYIELPKTAKPTVQPPDEKKEPVEQKPLEIEYVRTIASGNYKEIGLKIKEPRGQQVTCTVLDKDDKSMGTFFNFAKTTYTTVSVHIEGRAHLGVSATCQFTK